MYELWFSYLQWSPVGSAVIKDHNLQHVLPPSMPDKPMMLPVNLPAAYVIHLQSSKFGMGVEFKDTCDSN